MARGNDEDEDQRETRRRCEGLPRRAQLPQLNLSDYVLQRAKFMVRGLYPNYERELFETTKHNISIHLMNIFTGGELWQEATAKDYLMVREELEQEATVKEYLTVQTEDSSGSEVGATRALIADTSRFVGNDSFALADSDKKNLVFA